MNRQLFDLQEVDNHLARLKRERGKLDNGAHARGEHDTLQRAYDLERTRLSVLTADRTDRELQQKATEEKIARQQSRLMSAKSGHEITALERDLKALAVQRSDADEAILGLMDEVETSSQRLSGLGEQLKAKNAELATIEAAFARDAARLEAEMDAQRASREAISSALNAEEKQQYDEHAKRGAGVAVAHPQNGNCSACGMALTPFNLREIKTQTWPACESCGRLLFVES